MATIAQRIKEQMDILGLKQADIVEKTGINKGALSSYISGRYNPKQNNIYLLAKALDVNEAWIMGADVPKERMVASAENTSSDIAPTSVRIPVLGRVAAGLPLFADEEIIDYEDISDAMAKDGEYYGLRIRGDSMEPKFSDGDVVIVRKQEDADNGDIVIALVNGDDAVCKRLRKYADGSVALVSSNPAYEPIYFSGEEVAETPVKIIGKVKELRAKF